jgi:hypothetical protein
MAVQLFQWGTNSDVGCEGYEHEWGFRTRMRKQRSFCKAGFAVLKCWFSCWNPWDLPSFVLPRLTKKFVVMTLMLGCERYASAVLVTDAQEASQIDKGIWCFAVHYGYDALCRPFTSILLDSIPKVLDLALAKAAFGDVDAQSVLL